MLLQEAAMSVIGYRRVSSEDQNLDRQDLGQVDKVFEEKVSGKSAKDRPALQARQCLRLPTPIAGLEPT